MATLAINGGKPVRNRSRRWPQWPLSTAADAKRVSSVTLSNRWSYDGPSEWKFADAFTDFVGARHGLCCANGSVAIQLALEALDIGAHDEVIVPGLTWQATASACIDVNAVPVLVDVEADTWCLDARQAEAAVTRKTRAIIAVHLYGCMPDMTALKRLCRKYNLYLIEDCAHQHGSEWKDRGAGSLGDIGCFSFQESKVLSSGEGGFNTCRTKRIFERLYSLRNCGRGWQDRSANTVHSGNYRLSEWQAAMLVGGLRRLEGQVSRRDRNAVYLNSMLEEIPGILPMRRRAEVTRQSYFNFAFRLNTQDVAVDNARFARALNAELHPPGDGFEPPYQALNECSLYRPHTKRRYRIDETHWARIDPRRFELPVCTDAHGKSGVVVHHSVLLGTKRDMDDIAEAVKKVLSHTDELK